VLKNNLNKGKYVFWGAFDTAEDALQAYREGSEKILNNEELVSVAFSDSTDSPPPATTTPTVAEVDKAKPAFRLNDLDLYDLKSECERLGISKEGNKSDIIERLSAVPENELFSNMTPSDTKRTPGRRGRPE